VLANHNVEVNAGGYIKAWGNDRAQLTAGVNVNYQAYGNNQNQFTYGQGGYFSPQSFLALSFPINYHYQYRKVEAKAGVTPVSRASRRTRRIFIPPTPPHRPRSTRPRPRTATCATITTA
jgi:hypothetical protein